MAIRFWLRNTKFEVVLTRDHLLIWTQTKKIDLNSFFDELLTIWKKQKKLLSYFSENVFENAKMNSFILFC